MPMLSPRTPVLNDAFAGVALVDTQGDSTVWAAESDVAMTGTYVFGDADDDHGLREFRADFINCPAMCVSIDAIADGDEDYAADGILLACDTTARLDNHGVEGLRCVMMHVVSSSPIANILAGADDIALNHLAQTPPAMIPVARALLLLGSITACFLCGLRKCRSL